MNPIDHVEQAESRIYAQYRDKQKLVSWIGISGHLGNEIESAYQDIAGSYDIDSANTHELDVLGRIVGITRSFEAVIEFSSSQYGRSQFGASQFQPTRGITDSALNNDIYRLLIKAKIAKNTNDATIDGILFAVGVIIETDDISLNDHENMSMTISFGSLTDIEEIVLSQFDIIPKPQGVNIAGIINESAVTQFGRSQFGGSQFAYKLGG